MATTFKAYDTAGKLRLVGGGTPPTTGANAGIRWELARVDVQDHATGGEALAFVVRESARIARD
jgi:hypothetical protein